MLSNSERRKADHLSGAIRAFEGATGGLRVMWNPVTMRLFLTIACNEGATQIELAEMMGLGRPSISVRIGDLGDKDRRLEQGLGLIEQRLSPDDARKRLIFLTEKGRALLAEIFNAMDGKT